MFAKKRTKWLAVISAALVVAVAFAAVQAYEATRYRRALQQMYERSFYELVGGMGSLEINLSKLLVSDEAAQSAALLQDVRRLAENVQTNLATLPVSHAALSDTIRFVNQTGDYARVLSLSVSKGAPMSNGQRDTLAQLMERCGLLNRTLSDIDPQASAMWNMNSDTDYYAIASPDTMSPIETIDQAGIDYPVLLYDGPFSDAAVDQAPKGFLGPDVTQEEAIALAIAFYGHDRVREAHAAEEAFGPIPSWGVELITEDGVSATCHLAQQGGRIHWLMRDPAAYETRLSLPELISHGAAFLYNRGYGDVSPSYAQTYDGVCTINYAALQDGVVLYPDLIKLQLSTYDGSVVGIEAGHWLVNHVPRQLQEPAITSDDARTLAGSYLEIRSVILCVIPVEGGAERLAWECTGTKDGAEYLVYLDAMDGREINILQVIHADGGQLTL